MGKRKISVNNPWFVTLISTMIGIIAGLYITNYFENNRLYAAKQKALLQVETELNDNHELLKDFNNNLSGKYEPMAVILSNLNAEMNLIIHKDSLQNFLKSTETMFAYDSFTTVNATQIELHGDINFNLDNTGLMAKKLSNIVWDSYKQTDFLSITSFECVTNIETFYVMQQEINKITEIWKNQLYQMAFIRNKKASEDFINNWRVLLLKQNLLLEYYKTIDSILSECK
ncbi:MAG: hypothetical protein AAF611_23405 [Bacteroidota bacterium]